MENERSAFVNILENHAVIFQKAVQRVFAHIAIPQPNAALVHIPKSDNQIAKGGFPTSRAAHNRQRGAGGNIHADAVNDLPLIIRKAHVLH